MISKQSPYAHGRELDRLGNRRAALGVLDMVFSSPEWVHRRVEQVEMTTAAPHFLRRVSLDFTLPNPDITRVTWFDSDPVSLIPVDVLAKRPLQRFSIADGDGHPLHVLTRRQNGEVAWRAMEAYAGDVLSSANASTSATLSASLRVITQGSEPDALAEIHAMRSSEDSASQALVADDGFVSSAEMLARNFILIAVVPPAPGNRCLAKYQYEGSTVGERDTRTTRERRLESFGWSPTTFELPVPSFSDCETFHFEVSAPEGVELIDIVLGDEHPSRRSDGGHVDDRWALGFNRVLDNSPHLAHLATSRTADARAAPDEFIDPRVSVRLRVERGGWLRSSALAAMFVAIFLTASLPYVYALDDADQARRCWIIEHGDTATGEAETSDATRITAPLELQCDEQERINTDPAAFAVALLGVISLGVIRVGEHAYTARLLRRLRIAALAAAVLPIGAAWLLVFPGAGEVLSVGWTVLVGVAWVLAGGLVAVWRAPSG